MLFVIGLQLVLGILINYPPLSGQLIPGIDIWFLRLPILLLSAWGIYKWANKWQGFILVLSPIYFALWYFYPLLLIELMVWVWTIEKIRGNKKWIVLLVVLSILRIGFQKGKVDVYEKIIPRKLSEEIMERVKSEDILTYKTNLPLKFRRLSYNKPVFAIKNILQESVKFLDVETIFFGEFHPLSQKGIVVYYWPQSFLLIVGVYFYFRKKIKFDLKTYLIGSFVYFMISKEISFLRFSILWITLSFLIALAMEKINKYWKILVVLVLLYSFGVNAYNFLLLKGKWFDNRAMAMEFCMKNLPKDGDNYITRIFGNEKKYCRYYDKNCVLNEKIDEAKNICVFAGELLGRQWNNTIDDRWQDLWRGKGYKFVKILQMYDSIAYGYSDYLVVGEKE